MGKSKQKDLQTPWKNCPTVWQTFCIEFELDSDNRMTAEFYKKSVYLTKPYINIKLAFKIFYAGFMAGGNS